MLKELDRTYVLRLGYVVGDDSSGVRIAGKHWGTWMGVVAVFPDYAVRDDHFRPLPAGVRLASTNHDGMVVLR